MTQKADCNCFEENFLSLLMARYEIHVIGNIRRAQIMSSCSIFEHQEPWTEPDLI
jgi:hypothetical protein